MDWKGCQEMGGVRGISVFIKGIREKIRSVPRGIRVNVRERPVIRKNRGNKEGRVFFYGVSMSTLYFL